MILVDANVWIDHLRSPLAALTDRLAASDVRMHPYTIGEVSLGSLRQRARVLERLQALLPATVASHESVMNLIETRRLFSCGIGYVDAHLLASALLTPGGQLWTRDERLHAQAERLDVAYAAPA